MEWRQQSSVSCAHAFIEAQRWIEEVTGKWFGCNDFRAALENGVLLCDLINKLKPGIIKKVNRRSTPIAGLDNVNVFLKACGKLGLNVSQLFDPGDLQDLSTRVTLRHNESKRRLKNVLITIYWLGRKAHLDAFYSGPQLNFKAFEGLLGLALSRALDEGANLKDGWYPDGEEDPQPRRRSTAQTSVDSGESPRNLHPSSEGCESDAEAEQVFKMETAQLSPQRNRGRIPPPPPQRKQSLENGQYCTSPLASNRGKPPYAPQTPAAITSPKLAVNEVTFRRALSEDHSEDDFAEADPVRDDLFLRRLRQTLRQASSCPRFDHFLPRYWTPEEETRVHAISLGSRRRPWYHKMQQLSRRASRAAEEERSVGFLTWFLASINGPPGSAELQKRAANPRLVR
ncbi:LIM domain only protein 7 [Takifugu flavidus]|uniref:LIM domain only protein 7 n=1 Tax=Takifugu flavidus TaxID=433684 RepID=A0A5C6NMQ9_9TELE|nr:LIM domain only protein 7 [Takifugu flavidus]